MKVQLPYCMITINNISNLCGCLLCDAVVAEYNEELIFTNASAIATTA